jgi:membrane dipeptidase
MAGSAEAGSEGLRRRATELHQGALVILAHDHLPDAEHLLQMLEGGVTAKVLHVSLDVLVWEDEGRCYQQSCEDYRGGGFAARGRDTIARLQETISRDSSRLCLIRRASDLERAKAASQAGVIIGSEGSKLLEGSLERLREFYELGLRVIQLTWAVPNLVVDPEAHDRNSGLTAFGRGLVREMHRLGMTVDVAHLVYLSRKAFFEALELGGGPVLAGHCTVRPVSPQAELDEEQARAIADTGGVIALHFCRHLAHSGARHATGDEADLDDVIDNAAYIADMVGMEHVGLGCDFFRNDELYQRAMGGNVAWVRGCESAAELPNVTEAFLRRGFTEAETRQVLGENLLRLFAQTWKG